MTIAESGKITASTIASQPHANIYNLINTRSNVPDPADPTGIRKLVYVREPRIGRGSRLFPHIVIQRAKPSNLLSTANLTKSFMSYDFTIRIVCRDSDGDTEGNPTGAEQCADITDNILKTLNNATNRRTLISYGMANLEYDIETDEDDFEGKSIFMTEFDLRFERNLTLTT